MSAPNCFKRESFARDPDERPAPTSPALSDGEVNFLWWFIQGSIMDVDVRQALWQGWGLCERHTFGWLCVEAAFRHRYLHGPAIVYAELLDRARDALAARGRLAEHRLGARLRSKGPCHLCALGYGPHSDGYAPQARTQAGRDPSNLRAFLHECRAAWQPYVCARCSAGHGDALCRVHLIAAIAAGTDAGLAAQRRLVEAIASGAARYEASYRWELRGSDTAEDRGAFVGAVGWCAGWTPLLQIAGDAETVAG